MDILSIVFALFFAVRLLSRTPFLPAFTSYLSLLLLLPPFLLRSTLSQFCAYFLASILAVHATLARSRADTTFISVYFILTSISCRSLLPLLSLLFAYKALHAPRLQPSDDYVPPNVRTASAFTLLSFQWVTPFVAKAKTQPLQAADISPLQPKLCTHASLAQFQSYWERHQKLTLALTQAFGPRLSLGGLFKLILDICEFASPILLQRILIFLETGDGSLTIGMLLAVAMFGTYILEAIASQQCYDNTYVTQAQVRSALVATVFSKTTRLSPSSRNKFTTGQIQNLMSTDCRTVAGVPLYFHDIWSAVGQGIVSIVMLVHLLGWKPLASACLVLAVCIPVELLLVRWQTELREKVLKKTDERVKHVSEALGAMKLVKLYAWEVPMMIRVLEERKLELNLLNSILNLETWNSTLVWGLYTVLLIVVFGVYALLGNDMNASTIFPALGFFDILFPALMFLPTLVNSLTHAITSLKRLKEFLGAEELVPIQHTQFAIDQEVLEKEDLDVAFENASFSWDPVGDEGNVLSAMTLKIPRGSLVCVVGGTGSGKSSFLASLIGEVPATNGKVGIRRGASVSFCEQVPFICNASLRDNILFGKPYNEAFYQKVLEACSLSTDIETLAAGDLTEIGERGVNLSGGQKARVALARAVYSKSDICILDDPLSAVDTFVAKELFKKCITGELQGRTCIWVTNQLQFATLEEVDMVVMLKDGKVIEVGERAELLQRQNSEFCKLLSARESQCDSDNAYPDHNPVDESSDRPMDVKFGNGTASPTSVKLGSESILPDESSKLMSDNKESADYGSMEAGRLISSESKDEGQVKSKHYGTYLRAFGCSATTATVTFRVAGILFDTAVSVWLGLWADQKAPNLVFNFLIFLGLGMLSNITHPLSDFIAIRGAMRASSSLHERLLVSIFGAPMSFFYSTPQGRIVNRFSSDMDCLDSQLALAIKDLLYLVIRTLVSIIFVVWALPPLILVVVLIMFICYVVTEYYRKSVLDTRRLESLAYSPLYAHFSETLGGIPTLRAYNDLPRSLYTNSVHVDRLGATAYASSYVRRWLNIRMNTLGAVLIFAATSLAVSPFAENLSPGIRALVLSYSISIFSVMRWSVKMFTQMESHFNSVERVVDYSDSKFPQEEKGELASRLQLYREIEGQSKAEEGGHRKRVDSRQKPRGNWPRQGRIEFRNVEMRYRADLAPALSDVSFSVKPGEHIGIVGRTGAGKSSTIQCLFRLHEIDQGRIEIDGEDIRDMSVQDLRSCLGIIPQEAVCFSGTIRSNLDMFGEYSDSEVERALELCGLEESMGRKVSLEYEVSENGWNLSVGQRQLLCLGRALLKRSQVLILDEATSSVSQETDERVQKTLKQEMGRCTVLTVAHRLQTVMGSDRIIVMEKGRVAEMGRPRELLRTESLLRELVNETDKKTAAELWQLAAK